MKTAGNLIFFAACFLGNAAAPAREDDVQIGKDARWNEPRPDLPDLSVQFISRTPRFPGLNPNYIDIKNDRDGEGPTGPVGILNEKNQHGPRPGQEVTFTAVVRNVGTKPVAAFDYAWLYDGRDVETKRHETALPPGRTVELILKRPWEDGPHAIAFQVDREDRIREISAENNWVIDRTDALAFAFFVEQGVAEYFKTVRGGLGSYDFADWAQFQVRQMNKEFRDTIYPTCPDGIIERVRLDRVYIIPDGWGAAEGMHAPNVFTPVNLDDPKFTNANAPPKDAKSENFNNVNGGVDGVWGFSVELLEKKKEWDDKNFMTPNTAG